MVRYAVVIGFRFTSVMMSFVIIIVDVKDFLNKYLLN